VTVTFEPIVLHPIGRVERDAADAGLSGDDLRARPCRIRLDPALQDGLMGLEPGSDILVLFWCHQVTGYRLQLHPRGDKTRPLRGVFATRSQYRPNPIAATVARVLRVEGAVIEVTGLDAFDGSPVLDIKNANGQ
jgi:tRNA-Thr(GGU) m(6)t(6)A37 methyltransferase TsaA